MKDGIEPLVKTNIYPVPDNRFPFLGVHFTPTVHGKLLLGPNAVLATKREGYSMKDFNLKEFFEIMFYSGTMKIAWKYFSVGMSEMSRSICMSRQVKQLQRYVPKLTVDMVERSVAGVRAQAVNENGDLIEDFVFDDKGKFKNNVLHVRNAPSPAASASMAISKYIADEFDKKFFIDKKIDE